MTSAGGQVYGWAQISVFIDHYSQNAEKGLIILIMIVTKFNLAENGCQKYLRERKLHHKSGPQTFL